MSVEIGSVPSDHELESPIRQEHIAKLLADGKPEIYRRLVRAVEQQLFGEFMKRCNGNQCLVAERLGISRMTLRYKLKSLGMLLPRQKNHGQIDSPEV